MDARTIMIRHLTDNPVLLRDLLSKIPQSQLKVRRKPGKWSIHENACHLADVQSLLYDRFLTFKNVEYPVFEPFLPGTNTPDDHLMHMDLGEALNHFEQERKRMLQLLDAFEPEDWEKEATHPEYSLYTAEILLRHTLMHDHLHMYRIQEYWLTNQNFLERR